MDSSNSNLFGKMFAKVPPPGADGKTETHDKATNSSTACNCDPSCACNPSSLLTQEDFTALLGNSDLPARLLCSLFETAPFPVVFPAQSFSPSSTAASSLINNSKQNDQQKKNVKQQVPVVPLGSAPHALASVIETGKSTPGLVVDGSTPRLPLDLAETKTAWFARFDCAGVPKDLVKVDIGVRSRDLRVTVSRRRAKHVIADYNERGSEVLRWERISGSSTRRIVFPLAADLDKVVTLYENGMLTIKIPKKEGVTTDSNLVSVKVESE